MSSVLPEWSDRVDERGPATNPLNGNTSRNRLSDLFSQGLITSITLRLRYLSVFCWALSHLEDREVDDEIYVLKNVEKLFCLASRYRDIQEDYDGGISGMDGNSRFDYELEELDEVELDDLELLKNDGYAYNLYYEGLLQKFLLKRGGLELTDAGEEIADLVDGVIEGSGETIFSCAEEGRVTRSDLDEFAWEFANQSLYLDERMEDERQALQKVLLGFIEWEGDERQGTTSLPDEIPRSIELDVASQLKSTIEQGELEEAGASKLYKKYNRSFHRFRGAHSFFLMRSWQLQSEDTGDAISLSERDKRVFEQYRQFMRTYWLQVYAAYSVEAQLEALTSFLNTLIPPTHDYRELLTKVTEQPNLEGSAAGLLNGLEVTGFKGEMSGQQVTRDLMLYGGASRSSVEVRAPVPDDAALSFGELRSMVEQELPTDWDECDVGRDETTPNMVLAAKAVRSSLNKMHGADDEEARLRFWSESLGRTMVLLLLVCRRFEMLKEDEDWMYNYIYNRLDSRFASLPALYRFVEDIDDEAPVSEVGRRLLEDEVVETHLEVFYDRLRPGNIKRMLSFNQDDQICLEVDAEHGERVFSASPGLIRFDELNIFLRDCGLLEEVENGYGASGRGELLLEQLGEGGSS